MRKDGQEIQRGKLRDIRAEIILWGKMKYREIDKSEKLLLVEKLNWDYDVPSETILEIIEGKNADEKTFSRVSLFAKSLVTLSWEDLVNLWGLENCVALYTEKTRKMIFPKSIVEEYDVVFNLLRNRTLSASRQSDGYIEKLRSALLFNRRNRALKMITK